MKCVIEYSLERKSDGFQLSDSTEEIEYTDKSIFDRIMRLFKELREEYDLDDDDDITFRVDKLEDI